MEEKTYTIILADGTTLSDLRLNGNNFISPTEVTADIFEDNCSPLVISDGETEEIHEHAELVQIATYPDEDGWWIVFRDLSAQELRDIKTQSDIDYLAMMTGVDLEV